MWLDMRDASSWDQNSADVTLYRCFSLNYRHLSENEVIFKVYIHVYAYRLPECWIHVKSFAFTRMVQPAIFRSSVQHTGCGEHIFFPQKDCFVKFQLFSMDRHVRRFTLVSKLGWFYVSQISCPWALVITV